MSAFVCKSRVDSLTCIQWIPQIQLWMRPRNNNLPPSANKAAHSGFETQRRHHQKSKTEASVAPQKGLVFSENLFFKKKKIIYCFSSLLYIFEKTLKVSHSRSLDLNTALRYILFPFKGISNSGGSNGGVRDMLFPLGPNSFIFVQFLATILLINRMAPAQKIMGPV